MGNKWDEGKESIGNGTRMGERKGGKKAGRKEGKRKGNKDGTMLMFMKGKKLIKQWGWMISIWAASVIALGIVSMVFRLLMSAAGFKS